MDPLSPVDRPEAAEQPLAAQRFSGRASGTRRIVTPERDTSATSTPVDQGPAPSPERGWAQRALEGCWRVDVRLRGHLPWLLLAGAAASAGAAPWAASAAEGPARAPASVVLQFVALPLVGVIWLARGRSKAGAWQPHIARARLAAALRRAELDARAWSGAGKTLRLSILRRWSLAAGMVSLGVSSVLGAACYVLGHALSPALAGLSLWSASLLLLSELLRWASSAQAAQRALPEADLALAAREFSPVVDLSTPLQVESVFLDPTPLHLLLEGLATWRSGAQCRHADDCAAALQHHLWASSMPEARLELRRWLSGGAAPALADLIVDGSVLVDFQLGLERSDVQRVAERIQRYRATWGAKPIVLVLCSAAGAQPPDAAAIEQLVAQHDATPLIVALPCQATPALTAARASAS